MNKKTVVSRTGIRFALLGVLAAALGGCSTYYQTYYPDSGVYYGDSGVHYGVPARTSGYFRGGYGPVNPVDYPYWSIDYFYFSQYYHPYSVYVGYTEPLYYPYPGWALGYYRPLRSHVSLGFGFGYPWHGFGYRYPAYSFGFFSGYDRYYDAGGFTGYRHNHHRIRKIDRRLQALQQGDSYASRRELLGHSRVAGSGRYRHASRIGSGSDFNGRSAAQVRSSRADLLRSRDSSGSAASHRTLDRGGAVDSRFQRRGSDPRSARRTITRDPAGQVGDTRSAADGHRGVPIESLRGRVIVNSRASQTEQSSSRRDSIRDSAAGTRASRPVPAVDWDRRAPSSRQAPARATRGADNPSAGGVRGNFLDGANRRPVSPSTPVRRASPPPRPAGDMRRSSPAIPDASTAPSRRDSMRRRSGGSRVDSRNK